MPQVRKYDPKRASTSAERVAAHRARKREAERLALQAENQKRLALRDTVRLQVELGIEFLRDLAYKSDLPQAALVADQLDDYHIVKRLRELLFEEQLDHFEPEDLEAIDPDPQIEL